MPACLHALESALGSPTCFDPLSGHSVLDCDKLGDFGSVYLSFPVAKKFGHFMKKVPYFQGEIILKF